MSNDSVGSRAVGTFGGIVLAVIFFFVVLPMASCIGCVVCAGAASTANQISK